LINGFWQEYASITNSAPSAVKAEASKKRKSPEPSPLDAYARGALKARLEACYHPEFLKGDFLSKLHDTCNTLRHHAHVIMSATANRMLVSRAKLGYGIPRASNAKEFPLYMGYQHPSFYGMIEAAPDFVLELFDYVFKLTGVHYNHALFSFHENGRRGHIEQHHDAAHSAAESGKYEATAPIALFNIGGARTLLLTDPIASASVNRKDLEGHIIMETPFSSGDAFILEPPLNREVSLCV
jgi:hypothetical protein